jgi:carboxymethylenebutenolidase
VFFGFTAIEARAGVATKSEDVVYSRRDGKTAVGHLARPEKEGTYPGIVLIHEWWGLTDDIKAMAREFAELGFVSLAVDLYGGESTAEPARARELAGGVRNNVDAAFANLRDAFAYLTKNGADADRLASIGWCFGGGWSYQIAKNDLGVKASVIYYGRFNPQDDLAKMRAEIIGHFADSDRGISLDNVKEFQAKLKTQSGGHEIYIYPNTTHGFASREGANPRFNKDAADLAWGRTIAFLGRALDVQIASDVKWKPVTVSAGAAALTPDNTNIKFVGKHTDQRPDRLGGFERFSGKIEIDPSSKALKSISVDIDTTSIWTPIGRLTNHLKSADFFSVEQFPIAEFRSTKITASGGTSELQVTGGLTLLGVSKVINFPIDVQMTGGGLVLTSRFVIDRSSFGMSWGAEQVQNEVAIAVVVGKKTQSRTGSPLPQGRGLKGGQSDPLPFFDGRDGNDDGYLSGDEILEPMRKRIDLFDTDGDGKISREEFKARLGEMQERRNRQQSGARGGGQRPSTD